MTVEPMTYEMRMQRKVVKEILSSSPEGIDRDELARLAEAKGLKGEEFQKAFSSLLNGGHAFVDVSGKVHYVRNE